MCFVVESAKAAGTSSPTRIATYMIDFTFAFDRMLS